MMLHVALCGVRGVLLLEPLMGELPQGLELEVPFLSEEEGQF